jgi:hypothetical protein
MAWTDDSPIRSYGGASFWPTFEKRRTDPSKCRLSYLWRWKKAI